MLGEMLSEVIQNEVLLVLVELLKVKCNIP
jgi:hypothetical protein